MHRFVGRVMASGFDRDRRWPEDTGAGRIAGRPMVRTHPRGSFLHEEMIEKGTGRSTLWRKKAKRITPWKSIKFGSFLMLVLESYPLPPVGVPQGHTNSNDVTLTIK